MQSRSVPLRLTLHAFGGAQQIFHGGAERPVSRARGIQEFVTRLRLLFQRLLKQGLYLTRIGFVHLQTGR